jgi:hypothetical protein
MEYSKIIAVSGLPGLYELISSKNDGAIVRSLDDKSTKFVSSRIHNFSHLESIEVYTVRDNVNLVDILLAIQKSNAALPDAKDNASVKKYFEAVYPDLDFERVYTSDMKKMIKWWEVLKNNEVEIKLSEPAPVEEEEVVTEAPKAKKAAAEKPAAKEAVKEKAKKETKEAPKKKAEEKEAAPKAKKAAAKPAAAKEKSAKPKKEETKEAPKKKAAPKKKK